MDVGLQGSNPGCQKVIIDERFEIFSIIVCMNFQKYFVACMNQNPAIDIVVPNLFHLPVYRVQGLYAISTSFRFAVHHFGLSWLLQSRLDTTPLSASTQTCMTSAFIPFNLGKYGSICCLSEYTVTI